MKKKGFTLIELLAVIVILAVIALIAMPIVLDIVNNSKKNAFKNSVYALTEAAGNYVGYESVKGNKIEWKINKITGEEYISFNLSKKEDVGKLNVKGKVPKKGRVEITKSGDTFVVAIEDNLCGKKNFGETYVNLLSLRTDDICLLTSQTGGLDSDEADDLISTVTNLVNRVNDVEEKNSKLEEKINTIKSETINNIYPVGSIYMSTELSTVEGVQKKLGGEWEAYGDGRVLRGTTGTSEETGGSDTVSLTTANLPEHNHSLNYDKASSSTGSTVLSVAQLPAHNHTENAHAHGLLAYFQGFSGWPSTTVNGAYVLNWNQTVISNMGAGKYTANIGSGYIGSTSSVTATINNTGENQGHSHSILTSSTSTYTSLNGSNTAFSVLDPYITVYMYKRVK